MSKPTPYSDRIFARICARLAEGESLRSVCRDPKMPNLSCVMVWLNKRTDLAEQYARAVQARAERYVDEIVDIADQCEDPAKARLQVDARKWAACKMFPRKYGDKVAVDMAGSLNVVIAPGDADL